MNNFDKEEQRIHNAFSQIEVDVEKFKSNLPPFSTPTKKNPMKFTSIAAAIFILMIVTVTAYATINRLEFIRSEFNPDFIDFVSSPIEPIYSESNDIRMEIYGVGQIYNNTLVYVKIQDISEENRLESYIHPLFDIINLGTGGSISRQLHLDQDSSTAYYEIILQNQDLPTNEITIVSHRIKGIHVESNGGFWSLVVPIPQSDHPLLTLTDISITDIDIDYLVIHPIGMHLSGTHTTARDYFELNNIYVEIGSEINSEPIFTRMIAGSGGVSHGSFVYDWTTSEPIDVESVTAIIINGYRIEVSE